MPIFYKPFNSVDTADATQIRFGKNGAVHSYLETRTNGLGFVTNVGDFAFEGGNVGIGTPTPYGLTHWQKSSTVNLVATNTGADGQADTTVMSLIGQARGYSNNLSKLASIDFKTDPTTWYYGAITFNVANLDGTDTSRTPLEAMRINRLGNVGIGTTAPDHPLEVVGAISSADTGLQKATFANVGNNLVMTANAGATNVTSHIIFKSSQSGGSAAERMRINNLGNVGINTSNPYGGTGVTSMTVNAANYPVVSLKRADSHIFQIFGYYNHTTLNAAVGYMQFDAGGSERMRINENGNVSW